MTASAVAEKLVNSHADVLRDLTQKDRRDVAALVKWDRRRPTVCMAKLRMRAAAAHFFEAQVAENRRHLARLQDRVLAHG